MALFKGRSSLLEVQNRALIKTAKERAAQIDRLERELQSLQQTVARIDTREREVQRLVQVQEQLTLERDFYCKRVSALEQENREPAENDG